MLLRSRSIVVLGLSVLLIAAGVIGGPTNGLEQSIMAWSGEIRSAMPALPRMAAGMTLLGGAVVTLGVAGGAVVWLLWRREWSSALLLTFTVLGTRLLVDSLKDWVGRPRPYVEILPESLAFPSGHAANSMTTYLAVALIVVAPAHRRTAAYTAVGSSIVIGVTRIVLGVHWPSDVIGGWALGLLAAGAALIVGERSGALPLEAKHDVVGRHLLPADEDESS